ncbi:MAG: hypothetical protein KAS32_21940 [Candidatus Peribacteraceae bacterium]|nr:hypothetical protein [Candidatus Peribacteraceae bacterium]
MNKVTEVLENLSRESQGRLEYVIKLLRQTDFVLARFRSSELVVVDGERLEELTRGQEDDGTCCGYRGNPCDGECSICWLAYLQREEQ